MYTVPGIYQDHVYSSKGLIYMKICDREWINYTVLQNKETGYCAVQSARAHSAELLQSGELKDLVIQHPEFFI